MESTDRGDLDDGTQLTFGTTARIARLAKKVENHAAAVALYFMW